MPIDIDQFYLIVLGTIDIKIGKWTLVGQEITTKT